MKNNWIKFSDYTEGNFVGVRKRVTCVTLVGHDFSDVDTLELSPVNEGFSLDRVLVVFVCLTSTREESMERKKILKSAFRTFLIFHGIS